MKNYKKPRNETAKKNVETIREKLLSWVDKFITQILVKLLFENYAIVLDWLYHFFESL